MARKIEVFALEVHVSHTGASPGARVVNTQETRMRRATSTSPTQITLVNPSNVSGEQGKTDLREAELSSVAGGHKVVATEVLGAPRVPDLYSLKHEKTLCLRPEHPVGGRLSLFQEFWLDLTEDRLVLNLVKRGFSLEFVAKPPDSGIVRPSLTKQSQDVMQEEVVGLLQKGAIEPVDLDQGAHGFFSSYFLVAKKDGGWRPILNLKRLNQYMSYQRFKMESLRPIIASVPPGVFMASLDLKDAYLHVPVNRDHWRFLRFLFRGQAYQWKVIPFGLTSAPRIFTRIVRPLVSVLHTAGHRVYAYLDDFLILGDTPAQTQASVRAVAEMFLRAGFILNLKKSEPSPTQDLTYLGARFRTDQGLVTLPEEKIQALLPVLRSFLRVGTYRTAVQFLSLLGLLTSTLDMILYARLHVRPVQFYLKLRWNARMGFTHKVLITRQFPQLLTWWLQLDNLRRGRPLAPPSHKWTLTTDASGGGWGGYVWSVQNPQDRTLTNGLWDSQEQKLHINIQELRAVRLTLVVCQDRIRGSSVMVETDNTTVVSHIRKQGGVKSWGLWQESWLLFEIAQKLNITLQAKHRPGVDNVLADRLSRESLDPHEWTLSKRVVKRLFQKWGTPHLDLFATPQNAQLNMFCQRDQNDAFELCWGSWKCYAFPPLPLLQRVVRKIQEESVQAILIAPWWARTPWFPSLISLLVDFPISLPLHRDLLTQRMEHQGLARRSDIQSLHLTAWKLSGKASEQRAFQKRLSQSRSGQHGTLPAQCTTQDGQPIPSGAHTQTWIPAQHLFPES